MLVIDLWADGMTRVATFMQPFSRGGRGGRFRIGGVPTLVVGDRVLGVDAAGSTIQAIVDGVRAHAMVATLWTTWQ